MFAAYLECCVANRTLLLHHSQSGVVENIKKITIKDVIYWLAEVWNDVKTSTVKSAISGIGLSGNLY
jgi:hypothetical protein